MFLISPENKFRKKKQFLSYSVLVPLGGPQKGDGGGGGGRGGGGGGRGRLGTPLVLALLVVAIGIGGCLADVVRVFQSWGSPHGRWWALELLLL